MMEKLEHEQLDQDRADTKDIDKKNVPILVHICNK